MATEGRGARVKCKEMSFEETIFSPWWVQTNVFYITMKFNGWRHQLEKLMAFNGLWKNIEALRNRSSFLEEHRNSTKSNWSLTSYHIRLS